MSKPRILGYNKPFTPNSKADMIRRPKAHSRAKERVDDPQRRELAYMKRLAREKRKED